MYVEHFAVGTAIAITVRATGDARRKKHQERAAKMLKITRAKNGEVIFTVSGRMDAEHLSELKTLLSSEANGCSIILDLRDLTLVDQDTVSFLGCCEAGN